MSDSGMRFRIINEGDTAIEIRYTRVDSAYLLGSTEGPSSSHDHDVISPGEEIELENIDQVLRIEPVTDSDDELDDEDKSDMDDTEDLED